jgi:hypothetical protein
MKACGQISRSKSHLNPIEAMRELARALRNLMGFQFQLKPEKAGFLHDEPANGSRRD